MIEAFVFLVTRNDALLKREPRASFVEKSTDSISPAKARLIHPQTHDLAHVAAYPLRRYQPTTTHVDCAWTGTVRVQQPAPVGASFRPHALAHRLYPVESYVGQRSFEPHRELIMGVSRWLRRLPNTIVTTGAFPPLRFAAAKSGRPVPQQTFAYRLESHLKATHLSSS